jgi:hypothetical protein
LTPTGNNYQFVNRRIKNATNTILSIHEFKYDYNIPITERSLWTGNEGVTFDPSAGAAVTYGEMSKKLELRMQ